MTPPPPADQSAIDNIIFDVDGTLIDTNYHHTIAWFRAFQQIHVTPPLWRIHRAIGMGGDQLVKAVAGDEVESEHGDELRAAWTKEFDALISEVQPFEGAEHIPASSVWSNRPTAAARA